MTKDDYVGIAINQNSKTPLWDGCVNNQWGHQRKVNKLSSLFDNTIFWWIVGRYIGDGWTCINKEKHRYRVVICSGKHKYQDLEENLNKIGFNYTKVEERTAYKYHISIKEFTLYLERFGKYAHGKRLCEDIFDLPTNLLKSFIDGYYSADGCIYDDCTKKICSVSKELIYGMGQCIAKVYHRPFSINKTIRPKTCVIEGRVVNQRDTYQVLWKETDSKFDKAFYENGYVWCPIRVINKIDENTCVYNMEVEGDNSYTVNNIIVHNCQSVSTAGKQEGLKKDSNTKSSLLWECERLIRAKKPKYLMLENVKNLVSKKFKGDFDEWCEVLEEMGYKNYWKVMNAKDYGIPQNRERVFMVSILGDDEFEFPEKQVLKLRLKDVLEKEVDEKYYLSETMIKGFISYNTKHQNKGNNFLYKSRDIDSCTSCLRVNSDLPSTDNTIRVCDNIVGRMKTGGQRADVYGSEGIVGSLMATDYKDAKKVMVKEATKKGYAIVNVGDSINIEQPNRKTRRGRVGKGVAQTLTTSCNQAVLEDGSSDTNIKQLGNIVNTGNFKNPQRGRIFSPDGISPCLNAQGSDLKHKIIDQSFKNRTPRVYDKVSPTLRTGNYFDVEETNSRIRKLTPLECFRLMGVKDEDFFKIRKSLIETFYNGNDRANSQLYKLAGNSIVTNCMTEIFKKLF